VECRHFTVLAILKIIGHPPGIQSMREFSGRIFEPLRSNPGLLKSLRDSFAPFTATLSEVRCFDNATALQFECTEELGAFRAQARTLLDSPVSTLLTRHRDSEAGRRFKKKYGVQILESILDDPDKNYGNHTFGSVARSPCLADASRERWRSRLDEPIKLRFKKIHFLVSDEVLTNPRRAEEDIKIP